MRFPRTNLTDAGDFSSGLEAEHPVENAPVEYEGEKPVPPLWQSNFSLAPNVRFTRTPETLISKRRAPEELVREEIVLVAPLAPQPAPPPQSPAAQQPMPLRVPITVNVPFDIYLPEVVEPDVTQQTEAQSQPVIAAPVETTLRAASEIATTAGCFSLRSPEIT